MYAVDDVVRLLIVWKIAEWALLENFYFLEIKLEKNNISFLYK